MYVVCICVCICMYMHMRMHVCVHMCILYVYLYVYRLAGIRGDPARRHRVRLHPPRQHAIVGWEAAWDGRGGVGGEVDEGHDARTSLGGMVTDNVVGTPAVRSRRMGWVRWFG